MMIIYLIRHCHVRNHRNVLYGRLSGFPLSLRGRKAAKRVGRFLRGKKVEVIFSSPLQRALETAEFIQQKIGLNVSIETKEELLELDSKGWDGVPIRLFQKEAMKVFLGEVGDVGDLREVAQTKKLYKGETLKEAGERAEKFILKVVHAGKYRTICVVSHQDVLLAAIYLLLNKNLREFHEKDLPRGGVWKLVFKGEKLKSARLVYKSE